MPLARRGHVFLRHNATDDGIFEHKPGAAFLRFHLDDDVAVLAATTGLAHELAFLPDSLADRFAVSHLRLAHVGFHVELALHAVDEDFRCSSPMPAMMV
jgi:hypothetical protein